MENSFNLFVTVKKPVLLVNGLTNFAVMKGKQKAGHDKIVKLSIGFKKELTKCYPSWFEGNCATLDGLESQYLSDYIQNEIGLERNRDDLSPKSMMIMVNSKVLLYCHSWSNLFSYRRNYSIKGETTFWGEMNLPSDYSLIKINDGSEFHSDFNIKINLDKEFWLIGVNVGKVNLVSCKKTDNKGFFYVLDPGDKERDLGMLLDEDNHYVINGGLEEMGKRSGTIQVMKETKNLDILRLIILSFCYWCSEKK